MSWTEWIQNLYWGTDQVRSINVHSMAIKLQLQIGCSSHNWGCKVISPSVLVSRSHFLPMTLNRKSHWPYNPDSTNDAQQPSKLTQIYNMTFKQNLRIIFMVCHSSEASCDTIGLCPGWRIPHPYSTNTITNTLPPLQSHMFLPILPDAVHYILLITLSTWRKAAVAKNCYTIAESQHILILLNVWWPSRSLEIKGIHLSIIFFTYYLKFWKTHNCNQNLISILSASSYYAIRFRS